MSSKRKCVHVCIETYMHSWYIMIIRHYSYNIPSNTFSLGCDIQFAGSRFFEGSQFSVSGLSLAFYSGLYAYDGWYVLSAHTKIMYL